MAIQKGKQVATATVGLQFVADGSGLGRASKQISSQLVSLQRKTSTVGKSMAGIVPAFAATGGAAFAAFRFATQQAIQFQDSFAGIKKTLNFTDSAVTTTEQKFKNLSLEIRNLAKETPISVNELNKIGEIGGQLGISATSIGKFVDTISKLTVATTMGAEDAAFAISRLANITGTAEKDLDNLASVLVRLGNEFAATESEIINTSLGIATAMEALSSEFTNSGVDALAFATALKAVGVQSQSGATAVQRALDTLGKAVSNGGRELGLFADLAQMSEKAFSDLVAIDPARAFLAFLQGLRAVDNAGGNTFAVLEELGLAQQRTVRALRAMAFAADDVERALSTANQEFSINTALTEEAEKRYETFTSQTGILRNNINEIGIAMGDELLPVMTDVIQSFATIASAVVDLDDEGNVRNNHIENFLINMGIAATAALTALKAVRNISDEFSSIPGTAKGGGSSLFGDVLGRRSNNNKLTQKFIEESRVSYLDQLDNFYTKEMSIHLNGNEELAQNMLNRLKTMTTSDGDITNIFDDQLTEISSYDKDYVNAISRHFQNVKKLADGGSAEFLNNFDNLEMGDNLFNSILQAQGIDTKAIEKVMLDAKKSGVRNIFDTLPAGLDTENMTEIQQMTKDAKDKISDLIQGQVTPDTGLNLAAEEMSIKTQAKKVLDAKKVEIAETINDLRTRTGDDILRLNEDIDGKVRQLEKVKSDVKADIIKDKKLDPVKDKEQIDNLVEENAQVKNVTKSLENLNNQRLNSQRIISEINKGDSEFSRLEQITRQEITALEAQQNRLQSQEKFIKNYDTILKKNASMLFIEQKIANAQELGLSDEDVANLQNQYDALKEGAEQYKNELVQATDQIDKTGKVLEFNLNEMTNEYLKNKEQIAEIDKKYRDGGIPMDDFGDALPEYMNDMKKMETLEKRNNELLAERSKLTAEVNQNTQLKTFLDKKILSLEKDIKTVSKGIADDVEGQIAHERAKVAEKEKAVELIKKEEHSNKGQVARNKRLLKIEEMKLDKLLQQATANERTAQAAENIKSNQNLINLELDKQTRLQAEIAGNEVEAAQKREDAKEFRKTSTKGISTTELRGEVQDMVDSGVVTTDQTVDQMSRKSLDKNFKKGKLKQGNTLRETANALDTKNVKINEDIANSKAKVVDLEKASSKEIVKLAEDQVDIKDTTENIIKLKKEGQNLDARQGSIDSKKITAEKELQDIRGAGNKELRTISSIFGDIEKALDNGQINASKINKMLASVTAGDKEFISEDLTKVKENLGGLEDTLINIQKAGDEVRRLNTEFAEVGTQIDLNDKGLKEIKNTLKGVADAGMITQVQADDLIQMIQSGDVDQLRNAEGIFQGIGTILQNSGEIFDEGKLFEIPPTTKSSFVELRKIIGDLDKGFFNVLANFTKNFGKVGTVINELGEEVEVPMNKMTRFIKKLSRGFSRLFRLLGFFMPSAIKNFQNLELAIAGNTKMTANLQAAMFRLIGVIRGVATAILGLVANIAMMAGFMALMTTAMQIMENLSKTERAIKSVSDIMSGFFEGAQTREELAANKTELEKLLNEYTAMGDDYAEVVEAIQKRLDETNTAIAESNAEARKNMGEIGTELLFNTTVNDDIGDLTKRTEAIANYIGLRGEAENQLFKDNLSDAIGGQMIEGDISPRDLAESLVDVQGFSKESRTVFDAVVGSIEDSVDLIYDVPDYSDGLKNYYERNMSDLLDFFRENGDLGQILTEGQIFGSPADAENAIADSITNTFSIGKNFQDHFERNMFGAFMGLDVDLSNNAITITLPDIENATYKPGQFGGTLPKRVIGQIDVESIKLTKEFEEAYQKALEKSGAGNVDGDVIAEGILRNIIGELSTEKGMRQFEKDYTAMLVLGKGIIDQSLEITDSGLTAIAEMQNQAILSELRQFQNQGIIDEIIFPSKDRLGAERQLSVARSVMQEKAEQEAKALRDELDLAELSADKFSKTLKENLAKAAQELGDVFSDVPLQIRKSTRKIIEELMVKGAMQRAFEQTIQDLSSFAPMLAEQLSRKGVSAINVAQSFLSDRTSAFQAEGMLATLMPEFAKDIGVGSEQVKNAQNQAIEIGKMLANGLLIGLQDSGVIELSEEMINKINSALDAAAGPEGADTRSPSLKTMKIGQDMGKGLAVGIEGMEQDVNNAMINLVNGAIMSVGGEGEEDITPPQSFELTSLATEEAVVHVRDNFGEIEEIMHASVEFMEDEAMGLYATWEQSLGEIGKGLDVIFGLTAAQRALVQANYAVQKSEQALMATRRSQATLSERMLKHQIHLQKMEKEGRKGVITGAEELSILKQKVSLQEMLDKSQGKRSASERLAIANAEEELDRLVLAAEAGIVSALEVEVAQENLDELKGNNLSVDEQKIAVLELSEAESKLQETEDKAKETSDELIAAREKQVTLLNETANASYELEIAYDSLEASLDGVVKAEHAYEVAREAFRVFATDSGPLFDAIIQGYGGVGSHIDTAIKKTILYATTTETQMRKATEAVRKHLNDAFMLQQRLSDPQQDTTFKDVVSTMFGGSQGFQQLALQKAGDQSMLGINKARAKGQFKDDEEMNLASMAAKNLRNIGASGSMTAFEVVRALEGIFGIPFTLTAAGQLAVSEEGLKAAGLEQFREGLLKSGVNIYDTNEKLNISADVSRSGESGTTTAGYIPNINTSSVGQQKEFFANNLSQIVSNIPGIMSAQQLLTAIGANPDMGMYNTMLSDSQRLSVLPAGRRNQVEGYFNSLQTRLIRNLDDLGLTNYSVLRGFKYGGFMKPFQRALVGEYGPEMVTAVPGGGLRVQPEGGRGASILVDNINVQVTGVPSDPIQARKAAQQIQKALVKLGKEGSSGTGLRRN
jgi:TP901 family phage tail tape measure protein